MRNDFIDVCPFCGGQPFEELINQGFDSPEWSIECDNCDVNPYTIDSSRQAARDLWNKRAAYWVGPNDRHD